jgi:hypothetical protein
VLTGVPEQLESLYTS